VRGGWGGVVLGCFGGSVLGFFFLGGVVWGGSFFLGVWGVFFLVGFVFWVLGGGGGCFGFGGRGTWLANAVNCSSFL